MKIAIGSDHRGYDLKTELIKKLVDNNINCEDLGCFSKDRSDYPVFGFKVGESVSKKECDYGVVICGSGDGVTIAANKVNGVRCMRATDCKRVITAREHLNVNVIAFCAEEINVEEAFEMVKAMISTEFLKGRYEERTKMIGEYENK